MTEPTIEELGPSGAPVSPAVPATGSRFGLRWVVALVVVALVVATTAAGAWFLAGQSASTTLARWMPADTVAFLEIRLDLPGDQRQQLGNFLAHFPGFADQSILDDKLAETWDRLLKDATDGKHDFSTEIRPWFGGEIAAGVVKLPDAAHDTDGAAATRGTGLIAVSVKDDAAALAWIRKIAGERATNLRSETYAGGEIVLDDTSAAASRNGTLLIGDVASVKAAIDRNGAAGLPTVERFATALTNVDDTRLGLVYVDLRRYLDWVAGMAASASATIPPGMFDAVPDWFAGSIRADGDALSVRAAAPHTTAAAVSTNAPSTLIAHIPSSALFVLDQNDAGASIRKVIDSIRAHIGDSGAEPLRQVDQAVGLLGGWDAILGWIGETAIVVDRDASLPTGGLLIAPKDRAAADRFATQVRNALTLAGAQAGLTTRDEQHAGASVTVVTLPASAGSPVPEIAFAVTDAVVAVGPTPWVERVLDTPQGSSLAADARFSGALGRVDANHVGLAYANLAGIRELAEAAAPAQERDRYERDIKPYLLPFDAAISTSTVSSDTDHFRSLVIVK